jgi:general secretion pathway protein A
LERNPFNVSPDPRFFFFTPVHESLLAELLFAIQARQGLVLFTGESGSGKTTLLKQLLETLCNQNVSTAYVFHSRLDVEDLFRFILEDFGVTCNSSRKGDVIQALHQWLLQRNMAGDTPVIIIDEAQTVPVRTLDELRLLLNLESSNGKLVQIVLAGQSELDEKMRRMELRQLRQRVMFRCRLPLLSPVETSAYIQSRLANAGGAESRLFPEETVAAIYGYSKGTPRAINLLGEHALINAYAEQKRSISPEDIVHIASDFDLIDNPLSLGKEEISKKNHRMLLFPQLSPKPDARSSPGLSFTSEQSKELDNSGIVGSVTWPDPRIERILSLISQGHPQAHARGFADTSGHAPAPNATLKASVGKGASLGIFREESPGRKAETLEISRGWHKRRSGVSRYWDDVAESFRQDLRNFYSDCRRFLGNSW